MACPNHGKETVKLLAIFDHVLLRVPLLSVSSVTSCEILTIQRFNAVFAAAELPSEGGSSPSGCHLGVEKRWPLEIMILDQEP
jgi:hypothetical protein